MDGTAAPWQSLTWLNRCQPAVCLVPLPSSDFHHEMEQVRRGGDGPRSVVRLVLEQRQVGVLDKYLDALRPLRALPKSQRDYGAMARELLAERSHSDAAFVLPLTLGEAARVARACLHGPDAVEVGINCCVVTMLYQAMIAEDR